MSAANPPSETVVSPSPLGVSKVPMATETAHMTVSSSYQSLLPTPPPPTPPKMSTSAISVATSVPLEQPTLGLNRTIQPPLVAAQSLLFPSPPPPSSSGTPIPPTITTTAPPPTTATTGVQPTRNALAGISHNGSLTPMARTAQPVQTGLVDLPVTSTSTLPAVRGPLPLLATLPVHIPIVNPVLRYCEQTPYVVVPPVCEVPPPAVVKVLREQRNREHHIRPSFQSFTNRFLWQPSPSSNLEDTVVRRGELWRGVYWEHVDVHRYITTRLCGNPPPIE